MTEQNDGTDGFIWPPSMMEGFQQASEQAMEQQQEFIQQLLGASTSGVGVPQLGAMSQMATFKTRVQSGGRISIPDAEREALDIEEGDIVQTVVVPVKRKRSKE
ncbi:AbrB/MazE/SpoVT family DNA-binding domain-containing protein [Halorientalis sp.]|uniref:AbrB/MazE/SpoVT family DNA-binding domain-containing protein n=1 Tax=Halorientalis sp. TaxID=1931229 RepID=UPI00261364A3|nr:AbrB/MazE/SpoVT family DNA-binding domain-containing protein [Halorientalis sp.]